MTDITIPPEAAKGLAMAILEITGEGIDMQEASAACIAMLNAWPGIEIHTDGTEDWIELTLMQENSNGSD